MQIFFSPLVRRSLFAMLAFCLVLRALFAPYDMVADSVSYLDLADLIQKQQWHFVVNAYWHPGYPALLLLSRTILRTSLQHELLAARALNLVLIGLLFFAVRFALHSALILRQRLDCGAAKEGLESVHRETLGVLAAAVTLISVERDLTVQSVRPDVLLAILVIFATGFLMRVKTQRGVATFAGLGFCFGLAFLVKSVAFPLFLVTLLLCPVLAGSLKYAAKGIAVAALIFAALAGPYIGALSKQKGRFSAGESGGLNYAWYVDGADRFEQQKDDPSRYGLAKGELKHTSLQLSKKPPIYFFGMGMPGTEPQWFDPSFWNDGLKPHFNLNAQRREFFGGLTIVLQYFALRPQYLLLVGVLLMLGGRWKMGEFGPSGLGPILCLLLAQIGMYLVVYTEPRYIASAGILIFVVLLAFVRIPKTEFGQNAVAMCAVLFLSMLLCSSFSDSLHNMRSEQREGRKTGAFDPAVFSAADSLVNVQGIRSGDVVACLGEAACRNDFYWARLARVSIRTEIYSNTDAGLDVWQSADERTALATLRSTGAKAVVADFGGAVPPSAEWKRLGSGSYFVLLLQS